MDKQSAVCKVHGRQWGNMTGLVLTEEDARPWLRALVVAREKKREAPLIEVNGAYSVAMLCMAEDPERPHGVCGRVMRGPRQPLTAAIRARGET